MRSVNDGDGKQEYLLRCLVQKASPRKEITRNGNENDLDDGLAWRWEWSKRERYRNVLEFGAHAADSLEEWPKRCCLCSRERRG